MAEGSGEDWEWGDQRNGMDDQHAAGVTKRRARMVGSCRRPDPDVVHDDLYQVLFPSLS